MGLGNETQYRAKARALVNKCGYGKTGGHFLKGGRPGDDYEQDKRMVDRQITKAIAEHDSQMHDHGHTRLRLQGGGMADGDAPRMRADRSSRSRKGGKGKGGNNVNVIVASRPGGGPGGPPGMGGPPGLGAVPPAMAMPRPAMPPPPPAPPPGGAPPGGAPGAGTMPAVPGGPMGGIPPKPPMPPGGPPMPMAGMRKDGGVAGYAEGGRVRLGPGGSVLGKQVKNENRGMGSDLEHQETDLDRKYWGPPGPFVPPGAGTKDDNTTGPTGRKRGGRAGYAYGGAADETDDTPDMSTIGKAPEKPLSPVAKETLGKMKGIVTPDVLGGVGKRKTKTPPELPDLEPGQKRGGRAGYDDGGVIGSIARPNTPMSPRKAALEAERAKYIGSLGDTPGPLPITPPTPDKQKRGGRAGYSPPKMHAGVGSGAGRLEMSKQVDYCEGGRTK